MSEIKLSEITADEEFSGSETFLVNTPAGTRLATYNQLKNKVDADLLTDVKADLTQLDEKVDGLSGAESGGGYGTCDTATDTVAKVVSIDRYSLVKGGMPVIKFTHSCCANATLNISGKGAKPILVRGSAITADDIAGGDTCTFVYDGTSYHLTDTDAVITDSSSALEVKLSYVINSEGESITSDTAKSDIVTAIDNGTPIILTIVYDDFGDVYEGAKYTCVSFFCGDDSAVLMAVGEFGTFSFISIGNSSNEYSVIMESMSGYGMFSSSTDYVGAYDGRKLYRVTLRVPVGGSISSSDFVGISKVLDISGTATMKKDGIIKVVSINSQYLHTYMKYDDNGGFTIESEKIGDQTGIQWETNSLVTVLFLRPESGDKK